MSRKIVQVQTPDENTVALCNDGSLWYLGSGPEAVWVRMADIPQDGEPEPVMAPVDQQTWPPNVGGMDLWVRQDGEAVKIIDRDTFWIAVASKDQIVAAFISRDATRLLNRPEAAPETLNFDYEGQSFTVPADPIPF